MEKRYRPIIKNGSILTTDIDNFIFNNYFEEPKKIIIESSTGIICECKNNITFFDLLNIVSEKIIKCFSSLLKYYYYLNFYFLINDKKHLHLKYDVTYNNFYIAVENDHGSIYNNTIIDFIYYYNPISKILKNINILLDNEIINKIIIDTVEKYAIISNDDNYNIRLQQPTKFIYNNFLVDVLDIEKKLTQFKFNIYFSFEKLINILSENNIVIDIDYNFSINIYKNNNLFLFKYNTLQQKVYLEDIFIGNRHLTIFEYINPNKKDIIYIEYNKNISTLY